MQVIERLPSGLSVGALRAAARTSPRRAAMAGFRAGVGLALMAMLGLPVGPVLFAVGAALFLSAVPFVARAGEWSIVGPALVVDSRVKWNGSRFTAWRLEVGGLAADHIDRVIGSLRRGLDQAAGPVVSDGDDTVTRVGWGMGDPPCIDAPGERAGGPARGIWLRVDRPGPGEEPVVTFLASDGGACEVLRGVARTVDEPC